MVQNSRKKIGLTFNKFAIKVKRDFNQAQQNHFTFNRFSLKVKTFRFKVNKIKSSLSTNFLSRARHTCSNLAIFRQKSPKVERSGRPGRPKFEISEDVLLELRSYGFTSKQIADMLLVSEPSVNQALTCDLCCSSGSLVNRHMIVRIGWAPSLP